MVDESFRIYVEQLRKGHTETLEECFPPDFMDIHEEALAFVDPVHLTGEAYLADDTLVLNFNIHTIAIIPCRICNEQVKVNITVDNAYNAVPLDEIKGAVYNFRELLRETILLETPHLTECCQGTCPKRKSVKQYFADNEGYHPFADL